MSEVGVRRWIKDGTLKHIRLSRCLRLIEDHMDKVVRDRVQVGPVSCICHNN